MSNRVHTLRFWPTFVSDSFAGPQRGRCQLMPVYVPSEVSYITILQSFEVKRTQEIYITTRFLPIGGI